jgi:hypothetical protein
MSQGLRVRFTDFALKNDGSELYPGFLGKINGQNPVQSPSSSATFLGHPDRRWLVAEWGLEPAIRFTGPGRQLRAGSDVALFASLGGERSFAALCTNDCNQVEGKQPSIKFRFTAENCCFTTNIDTVRNECFAVLSLEASKESAFALTAATREQDYRVC